jgi:hypothetical protein
MRQDVPEEQPEGIAVQLGIESFQMHGGGRAWLKKAVVRSGGDAFKAPGVENLLDISGSHSQSPLHCP